MLSMLALMVTDSLRADKKYQDVQARLVLREKETIDALVVAAKNEEELSIAKKEYASAAL